MVKSKIKQLLLLPLMIVMLLSCTRTVPCPPSINAKPIHSKNLRKVRHKLRVKYRYHQTRVGRLFNFNLF
jgi:outer membrane biogenesis lipoprotein LolB